jgi:hypothetical protein
MKKSLCRNLNLHVLVILILVFFSLPSNGQTKKFQLFPESKKTGVQNRFIMAFDVSFFKLFRIHDYDEEILVAPLAESDET